MKIKEMLSKCCTAHGGSKKRGLVMGTIAVFLFVVFIVAVFGVCWRNHEFKNFANFQQQNKRQMMGNHGRNIPPVSISQENEDQFVAPDDASQVGEIAIIVNNLEVAKKAVSDAAAKSGGNVYATHIAYASDNVKNGSIVVQIPQENFDIAFGDLEKIGNKIIQESSEKIPQRREYPIVTPMTADGNQEQSSKSDAKSSDNNVVSIDESPKKTVSNSKSEIARVPNQDNIMPESIQNKGYIKVVFVDYGVESSMQNKSVLSAGSTFVDSGQNFSNKIIFVFILKSAFLIALLIILLVMIRRMLKGLHAEKNEKIMPTRSLKLQIKTRPRAVKTQRRKI